MAGIRLDWAHFGNFDSFDVYKTSTSTEVANLPPAIATNLKNLSYWDADVIAGGSYYYRVKVTRGSDVRFSDEINAIASTGPVDALFNNVTALVIGSAPSYPSSLIVDRSNRNKLVAITASASGAAPSIVDFTVTPPVFGEGSILMPKDTKMTIDIGALTTLFSVEFYIRNTVAMTNGLVFFETKSSTLRGLYFQVSSGNAILVGRNGGGYSTLPARPLNKWVHILLQQKSFGLVDIYQDGSKVMSIPDGGGLFRGEYLYFTGDGYYLSAIRATMGVLRYPTTTTIIPPTEQFPAQ